MKKGMANSISMTWQLLCDDHGVTREHYNQLKKFSPEALRIFMKGDHSITSIEIG